MCEISTFAWSTKRLHHCSIRLSSWLQPPWKPPGCTAQVRIEKLNPHLKSQVNDSWHLSHPPQNVMCRKTALSKGQVWPSTFFFVDSCSTLCRPQRFCFCRAVLFGCLLVTGLPNWPGCHFRWTKTPRKQGVSRETRRMGRCWLCWPVHTFYTLNKDYHVPRIREIHPMDPGWMNVSH